MAEGLAQVAAGYFSSKFKPKQLYVAFFTLSSIAGLAIVVMGNSEGDTLFIFLVLLAKFGVAASFTITYVVHGKMFPTLFSVTSMGIANFVSRLLTIAAPLVAEIEQPTPMLFFTTLCIASAVCAFFVKQPE